MKEGSLTYRSKVKFYSLSERSFKQNKNHEPLCLILSFKIVYFIFSIPALESTAISHRQVGDLLIFNNSLYCRMKRPQNRRTWWIVLSSYSILTPEEEGVAEVLEKGGVVEVVVEAEGEGATDGGPGNQLPSLMTKMTFPVLWRLRRNAQLCCLQYFPPSTIQFHTAC